MDGIDLESFPAADAKQQYFLTTKDLLGVPYKSEYLGFGRGRPTKWYSCSDLEEAAVRKYGEEGLTKKRAQRAKHEENQRKKILAAAKVEEEIKKQQSEENAAPNSTSSSVSVKALGQALKEIRKDIRTAFKPLVTWSYLRTRNSPHGCHAVAHVPRVDQAEFAALIGCPTDPNLESVVKSGAWYSIEIPFTTVMDSDEAIIGKGGRYGCNSELGIDPAKDLTVKFKPSDRTLSVSGYVQHVDTFGFNEFEYGFD